MNYMDMVYEAYGRADTLEREEINGDGPGVNGNLEEVFTADEEV